MAAAAPVLLVYVALARVARAVPMFDDYPAILGFAFAWKNLPTAQEKLSFLLASQHGEYKLIVEHALLVLDLVCTHRVHFFFLIWVGNLLALGIAWILYRMFFLEQTDRLLRFTLFLPILWFFFQLNHAENFDWAMCGLQTFPVVLFSLSSLHQLAGKSPRNTVLAALCAVLACFSSANGFLLAPIGAAVYLMRLQWRALILWTTAFVLAAAAYLYRYTPDPKPAAGLAAQALFTLSFLGGAFENQHRQPVRYGAVVGGGLLLGLVLAAFSRRFYRTHPSACCAAVWVLLTAMLVAHGRAGSGFDLSLTLRYKIYSDLLFIFCYGFLATEISRSPITPSRKRLLYASSLACAMLFGLFSDVFGYRYLVNRQQRVQAGLNQYARDPLHHSPEVSLSGEPIPRIFTESSRQLLTAALQSGLYRLPSPEAR